MFEISVRLSQVSYWGRWCLAKPNLLCEPICDPKAAARELPLWIFSLSISELMLVTSGYDMARSCTT